MSDVKFGGPHKFGCDCVMCKPSVADALVMQTRAPSPCASHEATLTLALERVKRLEEALRALVEWADSDEVGGAFAMAWVHGYRISDEFNAKAKAIGEAARAALRPEGT